MKITLTFRRFTVEHASVETDIDDDAWAKMDYRRLEHWALNTVTPRQALSKAEWRRQPTASQPELADCDPSPQKEVQK